MDNINIYTSLSPEFKEAVIDKVRIESDKIIENRGSITMKSVLNNIYSVITYSIDWNLLSDEWIRENARKTAETIILHINNDAAIHSILYRYICDFPVAKKAQMIMEEKGERA